MLNLEVTGDGAQTVSIEVLEESPEREGIAFLVPGAKSTSLYKQK